MFLEALKSSRALLVAKLQKARQFQKVPEIVLSNFLCNANTYRVKIVTVCFLCVIHFIRLLFLLGLHRFSHGILGLSLCVYMPNFKMAQCLLNSRVTLFQTKCHYYEVIEGLFESLCV